MEDIKYTSVDWSEHFYLNQHSPSGLSWVYAPSKYKPHIKKGDFVGSVQRGAGKAHCWQVMLNRKLYRIHRVIWCLKNGTINTKSVIDHLDGNPLNNSMDNLREVDTTLNNRNRKTQATNTSGISGVSFSDGRWVARWRDGLGVERSKSFSVKVYGEQLSKEMATQKRASMLETRNKEGAGYTDRHITGSHTVLDVLV